jgi:hypothetical protein
METTPHPASLIRPLRHNRFKNRFNWTISNGFIGQLIEKLVPTPGIEPGTY